MKIGLVPTADPVQGRGENVVSDTGGGFRQVGEFVGKGTGRFDATVAKSARQSCLEKRSRSRKIAQPHCSLGRAFTVKKNI